METIIVLADSNRGVYIPQHFAESIRRECVTGVTADDWRILEAGPGADWYWETWEQILNSATVTDLEQGIVYRLEQDGDLFAIAENTPSPWESMD